MEKPFEKRGRPEWNPGLARPGGMRGRHERRAAGPKRWCVATRFTRNIVVCSWYRGYPHWQVLLFSRHTPPKKIYIDKWTVRVNHTCFIEVTVDVKSSLLYVEWNGLSGPAGKKGPPNRRLHKSCLAKLISGTAHLEVQDYMMTRVWPFFRVWRGFKLTSTAPNEPTK